MQRRHGYGDVIHVRSRTERLADRVAEKVGGNGFWEGNAMVCEEWSGKAPVDSGEEDVSVQITLCFMLRSLRAKLETKVEEYSWCEFDRD
jgi:hypothetical protein